MDANLDFSRLANPAARPRLAVWASRALGKGRRWRLIHAGQRLQRGGGQVGARISMRMCETSQLRRRGNAGQMGDVALDRIMEAPRAALSTGRRPCARVKGKIGLLLSCRKCARLAEGSRIHREMASSERLGAKRIRARRSQDSPGAQSRRESRSTNQRRAFSGTSRPISRRRREHGRPEGVPGQVAAVWYIVRVCGELLLCVSRLV